MHGYHIYLQNSNRSDNTYELCGGAVWKWGFTGNVWAPTYNERFVSHLTPCERHQVCYKYISGDHVSLPPSPKSAHADDSKTRMLISIVSCLLTALFTKPPASWFPALPGTIPPFHCSIREAVNGQTASGGHSCCWYFWEQPVTKEPVALWIVLLSDTKLCYTRLYSLILN